MLRARVAGIVKRGLSTRDRPEPGRGNMKMRFKAVSVVVGVSAWFGCLQDAALLVLGAAAARQQGGTGGVLENFADALVGLGRALEVLVGADLLADFLTLCAVLAMDLCQMRRGDALYAASRESNESRAGRGAFVTSRRTAAQSRADGRESVGRGAHTAVRGSTQDVGHTSSGLTGFWLVLASSFVTFWS